MRIINSKLHGIIDYLVVIFLFSAPSLFDLPEFTSLFTYILGCIHLLLTVFTRFELGIFKIIPFRVHGWIEVMVAFGLIGMAFYLGSLEGSLAKNFYIGFATAVFLTWLLTKYNSEAN